MNILLERSSTGIVSSILQREYDRMTSGDRWATGISIGMFLLSMILVCNIIVNTTSYNEHLITQPQTTFQQNLDQMNWKNLQYITTLYESDAMKYLPDPKWQAFKDTLQELELPKQYLALERWIYEHDYSEASCFQVSHYVYILRRGGKIN